MNNNNLGLVPIVIATFLVAACSGGGGNSSTSAVTERETPLEQLALKSVRDCNDYREYLARMWIGNHTSYGYGNDVALPAAGNAAPDTITQTNVQEPGVDEQDMVKTDSAGRFFIAQDRYLIVETGFPAADLAELARLDLNMYTRALYFDEPSRRVAVFGTAWDTAYGSREVVSFIDVADPAQPRETSRLELSGWGMQTRRVGARVHGFLQANAKPPAALSTAEFRDLVTRYRDTFSNDDEDSRAQLYAEIVASVRTAVAAQPESEMLLAATRVQDGTRTPLNLLGCANIQRPDITTVPGLGALISFDLDGANASATAVAGGGHRIYATKENFYISRSSGNWWLDDGTPTRETAIYRFAIGGGARPEYRSIGKVRGWTQSAYNFSEHAGSLRVASNDGRGNNFLSVLQDDAQGNLARIAEVTGFGAQERMFATRFIGTRGFIVTFRQIDPLFAFDLSDSRNPVLKGELEIPGFSTYAHPLGDGHLLTVGSNGNGALQLQIFDVSDLSAPRLVHRYTPDSTGWSGSPANWDPHAFTFDAARGVLAIPYYRYDPANYADSFSGFLAFRVSIAAGITELTRVDHKAMAYDYYCDPAPRESWYTQACGNGGYGLWTSPRRTVVMTSGADEYLYTLSNVGIQVNHLRAPDYPMLANDGF